MNFCAGCEDCIFAVDKVEKQGCYEIHLTTDTHDSDKILSIGQKHKIKFIAIDLGKNKKNIDNKEVFMLTHRFYDKDIVKFNEKIINMYELLKMLQVDILKTIKEQCMYDTDVSLDNEWFKGNN